MFLEILLVLSVLYAAQMVLFAAGASLAHYPVSRSTRPTVSVIIAARNEEQNIGSCLDSMLRLSYPADLLEVIVIDDRSDDNTQAIVRSYAERCPRVRLVVAAPGQGRLRGKTNAVTQGIEMSTGEILLFTDADCTVPPHWVEETVKYYTADDIGIVAGFTELRGQRFFDQMQSLDWLLLFSVAAAAIRLHYPVTAVGNNLSVRRRAYDAVGGYRQIPFSVTEDYALFHAVTSGTGYQARFPMDAATLVESTACKSWRDLYRQKYRWFTGGKDMDLKSIAIFGLSFALNVAIVAGIAAGLFVQVATLLAVKVAADLVATFPALAAFKRWNLLRAFFLFELYYFLYVLLYPPLVLIGSDVVWKERAFRRNVQK